MKQKSKIILITCIIMIILCTIFQFEIKGVYAVDNINNSSSTTNIVNNSWQVNPLDKIEIRENDSNSTGIYINLEDGYSIKEDILAPFKVEWRIEDESIATYTSEDITEQDIANGKMFFVGKAEVKGIKAGTTKLIATITEIENDKNTITLETPIIVHGKDEKLIIGWNFSLNKKELEIKEGKSDELIISASTDMMLPAVVVNDYWNTEWKVEDETIAKCTAETGLTGYEAAGKARIEGLKAGTTKIYATVSKTTESGTETVEFEIPITVTETIEDKKDDTIYNKPIVQAGTRGVLVGIIGIGMVCAIVLGRKIKK